VNQITILKLMHILVKRKSKQKPKKNRFTKTRMMSLYVFCSIFRDYIILLPIAEAMRAKPISTVWMFSSYDPRVGFTSTCTTRYTRMFLPVSIHMNILSERTKKNLIGQHQRGRVRGREERGRAERMRAEGRLSGSGPYRGSRDSQTQRQPQRDNVLRGR
jgi:hypothetical protein